MCSSGLLLYQSIVGIRAIRLRSENSSWLLIKHCSLVVAGLIFVIIIRCIVEIDAVSKIIGDIEHENYSSGNYILRHPYGG